ARNRAGMASAAPSGQRERQKKRSIKRLTDNNNTANNTNHHSRIKRRTIAVLKGSTSAKTSAKANEPKEMAKRAKNMRYLIAHKRSCSPQGTLIWGILSALAILLVSSCKAPKGHSQPQKAPRPQKISAIAMAHHSMKISGSMRKASQEKPSRNAVVKVSTLTTEGWAVIIQPSQIRVMVRYTVRIRS